MMHYDQAASVTNSMIGFIFYREWRQVAVPR